MGTAERRKEIMHILCRRRYEKISNLAEELGVSKRTILRDIEILSISEPIYTQCGRYGGGVYVTEDYFIDRMYMSSEEIDVLNKLYCFAKINAVCNLGEKEIGILKLIISQYTKPNYRRENKNEKARKRVV